MNEPGKSPGAIFDAAIELQPGRRVAYLDEACGGDAALRQRVEALLHAHESAGKFMENPAADPVSQAAVAKPSERAGDRIGRYKLLQPIGEGGCGIVYMAQQEEPVHRRVALKVVKLGMDTRQVIARFEAERQTLALMDHPNIAKVLDAGATDTGRPYFVMELVRGIKITDYCDENNLTTVARLKLFIQVCQAVQHAHQKGIIHRDLKPSNILVADHDGVPVPRIIDFGIAKATTDQRLTDKTLFTAFEQFIGTPAYMSPEQARLSGLDIDTRSDIYSLGVLLYELLTGNTPFEAKRLLEIGLDEVRRIIREEEPVPPSTRLHTLNAADQTTVAKHRQSDPPKLVHLIRGDLDWIVMKCLEKDRTRRYETANGLAADIQRHLSNEPVVACPPSNLYRFQKLVRRNKLGFIAAGAVVAALIIGLGVATWSFFNEQQARRQAEAERKMAKMEATKATAISDFLQQSLRSANPDELKGSDYTVRQLLDDFSAGLENQFQDQPEVEAAVRVTLARAYYRLGLADKAQPQMERALILRRRIVGGDEQVAATLIDYAWTSFEQGQFVKGESQAREALDIYRKRGVVGQPVISGLAVLQRILISEGRIMEVEAVTEQASLLARKSPGVEYPELATMIHGLAEVRIGQSNYADAEALAQQAVAMHRRVRREGDVETGWALVALGKALRGEQKLDAAESAFRDALAIFRKQYSSGHKSVSTALGDLKAVLEAKGDYAGLVALYLDTLTEQRAALRNGNPDVAETLLNLAGALQVQGKQAEFEKALREALPIVQQSIAQNPGRSEDSMRLGHLQWQLGQLLMSRHELGEAEQLLLQALQVFTTASETFPSEPFLRQEQAYSHRLLGDLMALSEKWDESAGHYRAAISLYAALAAGDPKSAFYLAEEAFNGATLALMLDHAGRPDQAVEELRRATDLDQKGTEFFPDEQLFQQPTTTLFLQRATSVRISLMDLLYRMKRYDEAEKAGRDGLALSTKLGAVGSEDYAALVRSLREVLKAENKPAEVEKLYGEVIRAERSALGKDSPAIALTLIGWADFLKSQSRTEEAAQKYREAVDGILKQQGDDPLKLPSVVQQLAQKLTEEDAAQFYEDAIQHARQNWGNSHAALGLLYYSFSDLLRGENKLDAAVEQCRNALQIQSATRDEALAATLRLMGWLQLHSGNPQEAEQSLRVVLEIYRALPRQEDYRRMAYPGMNLGIALFDQHNLPEAEQSFRDAVALISQHRATDEDNYTFSACWLVMVLKAENKLTESESLLHDVTSQEGQTTAAAQLLANASALPKAIWPDESAKWLLYSSEILDKASTEDVAKLPQVVSMLVEAGYERQATNLCRRMLNSTSTDALWFNNASWCFATTENPSNRDPALAVELANRAVQINPQGDWNTVGVAYYRAGDFKQAIADLEKSAQQGSGEVNSFNRFFQAMAEHQVGHADAARNYYTKAMQWMNKNVPQNAELLRFRAEAERLLGSEIKAGAENQFPATPAAK